MAEPTTYNLPRGCTAYQCQAIRRNPSGLLGRFGLSGQPQNTWQNYGRDFERVEDEWKDRGIDDTGALCCPSRRLLSILTHLTLLTAAAGCCCSAACGAMPYLAARKSEAVLGGLSTFNTWYNKGSAQQHSDFKATVCQRVYTTFKLRQPASWWLDVSCGGGSRQMVAATCGLKALGLDLRSDCIQECAVIARRLQRRGTFATGGRAEFRQGDMREVELTVAAFIQQEEQDQRRRRRQQQQQQQQQQQHPPPRQEDEKKKEEVKEVAVASSSSPSPPPAVRFGGMFTSIPFWTLEKYDAAGATITLIARMNSDSESPFDCNFAYISDKRANALLNICLVYYSIPAG